MTIHWSMRCSHCRIRYPYQASGPGSFDSINDNRYCPECQSVVLEALKAIPVKIERRLIPTDDFAFEELLKWHKEEESLVRRVFVPLIKIDSGRGCYSSTDSFDIAGRGDFSQWVYHVAYWPKENNKVEGIWKYAEYDLINNKVLGPWRDQGNK